MSTGQTKTWCDREVLCVVTDKNGGHRECVKGVNSGSEDSVCRSNPPLVREVTFVSGSPVDGEGSSQAPCASEVRGKSFVTSEKTHGSWSRP